MIWTESFGSQQGWQIEDTANCNVLTIELNSKLNSTHLNFSIWKKYSLLLSFSVPWQAGSIAQVLCSCSEVFSGAGRRYASKLFRLLFCLQIWSSSCLKKRQHTKSGLFTMAVVLLIAALIVYGKWVGVRILLFMVSRETPWRSIWQLQWFLWFALSVVCSSHLKMYFGWGKSWRKCVAFCDGGDRWASWTEGWLWGRWIAYTALLCLF